MAVNKTFNDVKVNVAYNAQASDVTTSLSPSVASSDKQHAGNIYPADATSTTQADLAVALGKIKNWYDNWHKVVWTGDAGSVGGHTVSIDVPSNAVFTDTTYTLSGAYGGTSNSTWVTTLTPSTGTATTSTVPTASTSVYGITKLSTATNSTSTSLAATASAVKAAYDLANGKSVVSFTQSLSSGTKIGTITIDGTATDLYAPSDTDTKVTQNILATSVSDTYPLLVSYYKTGVTTTTAQTANRVQAIYVQPSTGTITATVFNENGTTLANKYAAKTHNHDGIYVSVKPDGSNDLFDSNNVISSVYLPSYVDDVLEGYYKDGQFYPTDSTFTVTTSQPSNWATTYTNYFTRSGTSPNYVYTRLTSATAPTWAASTYYALSGTAMTGQSDTIYIDIGVDPAESYRWTGSTYASMKCPTIHAVSDVVKKSNGVITKSYTDGTASADITVYEHPTTAGNKHIPSGGSSGQYLKYGGSSGTASWSSIGGSDVSVFTKATSSAAGTQGTVPAPAQTTYNANGNRHYLRSDGVWSNDPVTTYDTIQLNVV